jgi:hypothetical protein
MTAPVELRPGLIEAHLAAMFDTAPDHHFMVLTSAPLGGEPWSKSQRIEQGLDPAGAARNRAVPVRDVAQAVERIVSQGPTRNIYVSACTVTEPPGSPWQRVKESTAAGLVGFWADVDVAGPGHKGAELPYPPTIADALELLDDCPLPATTVIETGGGLHAWWMFDQFVPVTDDNRADWRRFSGEWHTGLFAAAGWRGWHLDKVGDLARVMRVAGTIRTKQADPEPRLVTIHEASSGHRYQPGHVVGAAIEPDPPPPTPEPPQRPTTVGTASTGSSGDPGRYGPVNAISELSWAEILVPHQWTRVGEEGGAELWRRPGGTSAYSLKADTHAACNWSSALKDWPVGGEGREKGLILTKWRVWCLVNGFGYGRAAESAASKYIREQQNDRRKGVRR